MDSGADGVADGAAAAASVGRRGRRRVGYGGSRGGGGGLFLTIGVEYGLEDFGGNVVAGAEFQSQLAYVGIFVEGGAGVGVGATAAGGVDGGRGGGDVATGGASFVEGYVVGVGHEYNFFVLFLWFSSRIMY